MNINKLFFLFFIATISISSIAIAGHHYGGYGYMGKMQNMTELDADNDGVITFEEFVAPTTEKWKSGFDMIDTNGDNVLDGQEYDEFLKAHGFNNG